MRIGDEGDEVGGRELDPRTDGHESGAREPDEWTGEETRRTEFHEYEVGEHIGGYELIRELGQGGFGTVYLGRRQDGEQAAIKVLHASAGANAEIRRRFRAEVEHSKRVKPYFIAEVIDADTEADPPWVISEYVDGRTLSDSVNESGPLAGDPLYRLALATATALAAVHNANIVHRDFTPTNIIITREGVRVIDFGIARTVESGGAWASAFIGTPRYMAPEQIEGAEVTTAIDVHAWGAVMVFAATGRHVFDAPSRDQVLNRVRHDDPDLGGVPEYLARIVIRCLRKDPVRRPTSQQLLSALLSKEPPTEHEWLGGARDSLTLLMEEGLQAFERSNGGSRNEPFQMAGAYYADIAELANGMQHHWNAAREMLDTPLERHALLRRLPESQVRARRIVEALPEDHGGADVQAAHLVAVLAPGLPAFFRDYDMSWGALFSTTAGRAWPYRRREDERLMDLVERYGLLKALSEHHCIGSDHPCARNAPCVLYGRVADQAADMFERLRRRQVWLKGVAESFAFTPREISPVDKGDLVHMLATHDKRRADRGALMAWAAQGITEGRVRDRVCAAVEGADDPWPVAVALWAQREDLRTVAERWARLERDDSQRRSLPQVRRDEDVESEQRTEELVRERERGRLRRLETGPLRLLPQGLQGLGAVLMVMGALVGALYWGDLALLAVVSTLAGAALVVIGVALGRDQRREIEDLRGRSSRVSEPVEPSRARGPSGEREAQDLDRTQEMRGGADDDEDDARDKERLRSLRAHLSDFPD